MRILRIGKKLENNGFTLLELLIVLFLISVMSALAVPRLSGSIASVTLKSAVRKTAASLRYARNQAASEKAVYRALADFEKNRLIVLPQSLIETSETDESEWLKQAKVYDLPEGVRFQKTDAPSGVDNDNLYEIAFYPAGNSSGGEIVISDEQHPPYRIQVDFITGMVRISDSAYDADNHR